MIRRLQRFGQHRGFMKYFKNTVWLMAGKVLRLGMALFVAVWMARYLGPERFGVWSYAISFVGIFAVLAKLGLDSIVVRDLVRLDDGARHGVVGTAFFLKLAGAALLMMVLVPAVYFMPGHHADALIFLIAAAAFLQSFGAIDLYFQSRVLGRLSVYANVGALMAASALKVALIVLEAPLIAFAWAVIFENAVLALGYAFLYARQGRFFRQWRFDRTLAARLLHDSWPMILSGMVVAVYMKIDQVMLMQMLGSEAVGQYAVAVRLSEVWYFIPTVIVTSLFPAIVRARELSTTLYYARLQRLYDFMAMLGISVALVMTFASDWVVARLYGLAYQDSGGVLAINIWAGVFVFLGVAYSKYLVTENLMKKSLYRTSAGMIVNIVLNLLMIPKYGIYGAAIATLLGQLTANMLYDLADADLRHQFVMKLKSLFPVHLLMKSNKEAETL